MKTYTVQIHWAISSNRQPVNNKNIIEYFECRLKWKAPTSASGQIELSLLLTNWDFLHAAGSNPPPPLSSQCRAKKKEKRT